MSEPDPVPVETFSLPSGAILERYADGLFRYRECPTTRVREAWLYPEDRAALVRLLSRDYSMVE